MSKYPPRTIDLDYFRANPDLLVERFFFSPYNNQLYELTPSERSFIKHAFAVDSDGNNLYPTLLYGAIKKSRKTELASILALVALVLFGGKFAEIYIVSNSKEQSQDRCFTGCARIVQASPLLQEEAEVTSAEIYFRATESKIKAIAANAPAIAGAHPVLSVFDETHAAEAKRLLEIWEALMPSPTRNYSARLMISHAGTSDDDHLLYQLYKRGLELPLIDKDLRGGDGMLMFWSHEPLHSWQSQKWIDAARRDLTPLRFQMMMENHFVGATDVSFIDSSAWSKIETLSGPTRTDPKLEIYAGVDIGVKRDCSGIAAVFGTADDMRLIFDHLFKPIPGRPVDLDHVEQTLITLSKSFKLKAVYYDPREMYGMAERLKRLNLPMTEYKQSTADLIVMSQCLYDAVTFQKLQVYPSTELRNSILNVVGKVNTAGMRMDRSGSKSIDLAIALALAVTACTKQSTKIDWAHKWRAYDPLHRDDDLPPLPEPPDPGLPRSNAEWWKHPQWRANQSSQKISGVDPTRTLFGYMAQLRARGEL